MSRSSQESRRRVVRDLPAPPPRYGALTLSVDRLDGSLRDPATAQPWKGFARGHLVRSGPVARALEMFGAPATCLGCSSCAIQGQRVLPPEAPAGAPNMLMIVRGNGAGRDEEGSWWRAEAETVAAVLPTASPFPPGRTFSVLPVVLAIAALGAAATFVLLGLLDESVVLSVSTGVIAAVITIGVPVIAGTLMCFATFAVIEHNDEVMAARLEHVRRGQDIEVLRRVLSEHHSDLVVLDSLQEASARYGLPVEEGR